MKLEGEKGKKTPCNLPAWLANFLLCCNAGASCLSPLFIWSSAFIITSAWITPYTNVLLVRPHPALDSEGASVSTAAQQRKKRICECKALRFREVIIEAGCLPDSLLILQKKTETSRFGIIYAFCGTVFAF